MSHYDKDRVLARMRARRENRRRRGGSERREGRVLNLMLVLFGTALVCLIAFIGVALSG